MATQSMIQNGEELGPPVSSAAEMLAARITTICSDAASVCVAEYESAHGVTMGELTTRVESLLDRALEVVSVASLLYTEPEPEESFDLSTPEDDGNRPSGIPSEVDAIADVVMLARMGLRSRQRRLDGLEPYGTHWERLAVLGSSTRTIQKSLGALLRAMSNAQQIESSSDLDDRTLAISLDVRKRYVRFHRAVTVGGAPAAAGLPDRFRRIGSHIALTLGKAIAVHMRTQDRALFRMTHAQLREWLLPQRTDGEHVTTGLRLYQDVANMATMFLEVNRREELVRHDALLARRVLKTLRSVPSWTEGAAHEVIEHLRPMTGRSSALDALLDREPSALPIEALVGLLETLSRELGAAAGIPPTAPPPPPAKTAFARSTARPPGRAEQSLSI